MSEKKTVSAVTNAELKIPPVADRCSPTPNDFATFCKGPGADVAGAYSGLR
jgi:hypothetical protein